MKLSTGTKPRQDKGVQYKLLTSAGSIMLDLDDYKHSGLLIGGFKDIIRDVVLPVGVFVSDQELNKLVRFIRSRRWD